MSDIVVEDARPTDLDALVALETVAFASDRIARRSLRRLIGAATASCRVARDADGIAGYHLVLFRRNAGIARLYSIAVHPDRRGQGVAALLLADAEDQARQRGLTALRLEVGVNNLGAIRLYRRHGYRQFGRYRRYYTDNADALRFEKQIDGG